MTGGVQLRIGGLPLDPRELARLPIRERARIYAELGLDPEQREVIEEAARLVRRREYRRGPAR
jgi:hypothetical protein